MPELTGHAANAAGMIKKQMNLTISAFSFLFFHTSRF